MLNPNKRITWYEHNDNSQGCPLVDKEDLRGIEYDNDTVYSGTAVERLAEYENIGLSPQDIRNLMDIFQTVTQSVNYKLGGYSNGKEN